MRLDSSMTVIDVGSVVGRYQPLADNRGVAPQSGQAGFLQSGQETLASAARDACRYPGEPGT
jgi:hypothetical protein